MGSNQTYFMHLLFLFISTDTSDKFLRFFRLTDLPKAIIISLLSKI